ncbi:DNA-binding response regulator [Azospirillum brasilense]|uniref:DNA-binding response regulator n=1 Tax=Azospirillum brasilense TaxID=192 RepID=A0A0P0EM52_AZOBR|nr:response regulator transcription factor [Azospirillum brasilense]PWC91283.1 response regulator receiver protein [Azospirillum sp. Sp 7]ALJ37100.1 two-component system response regulator [Azospirillum brasilense]NUB15935.1 response regulator [Azospirillum brasilense]OPH15949.1 response regulator receiver protein [Azospirillum brasilense]OPH20212.1 response regulator receiver protein [Azospirillum brasilense]
MSVGSELVGRTVLVVEDSPETQDLIATYLEHQGLRVLRAANGAELTERIAQDRPDLVLLDINLPDCDGLALAERLRLGETVPLIFVTGRDSPTDRIAGLSHGGDYVTKPVDLLELLIRIRNLLRRSGASASPSVPAESAAVPAPDAPLAFRGWRLDLVRRALFRPDGSYLALTTGEFNILAALAAMRPNPVSREYLLDVISNRDPRSISEHTVDTLITRLRRKMRLDDGAASPIVTVRGVGYALESDES